MGLIKKYKKDLNITDFDYLLGSDGDDDGSTKNYYIGDLKQIFGIAPVLGMSDVPGLLDALLGKVDNIRVQTDVPAGAVFTDTIYTLPFADNSVNWNAAYGWGDHSGLYSLLGHNHAISDITNLQTTLDGLLTGNPSITAGVNKTKISYDSKGLVTGGDFATTLDIPDSTDRRYVTDLQRYYIDQDVTLGSTPTFGGVIFQPETSLSHNEGLLWYNDVTKALTFYNDEEDTTLEIGEEMRMRVFNNSGVTIGDGKAVTVVGTRSDGTPDIDLAIASIAISALNVVGIATHSIEDQTYGWVTTRGFVRGVDTSSLTNGSLIYLSSTVAGGFTITKPESPAYEVKMGGVAKQHVTEGVLYAEPLVLGNTGSSIRIFNGSILEPHKCLVGSDGTTMQATIQHEDTVSDISLFFDSEFTVFSAPANVNLTAGTDSSPVLNYVYIPKSTKVLTANTTGFPKNEQVVAVAQVLCPSASHAQTYGFRKVHAWTDHLADSNGQGHLAHLNAWIRNKPAQWVEGNSLTTTPLAGTSGVLIDLSYTIGTAVYQLHEHSGPAFDTSGTDNIYVINDFTTPYKMISNLNSTDLSADSNGNAIGNKYYNVVIWSVISEEDPDCQLYMNLPSTSYTNLSDAVNDISNSANFTIPSDFKGSGYLLTKLILKNSGGNIEIVTDGIYDLRGLAPALSGGGTIGSAGVTTWLELTDTPISYVGQAGKSVVANSGETGLEFKDLVIADIIDFADNSTNWNIAFGWGDHSLAGYLTSETSHADVVIDGDFASNGIMTRTALGVYTMITDNSSTWDSLNTNVPTSLSIGTITATTLGITSDGGANDIVLPEANTTQAGLLGSDKWDEIVVNTSKTSFPGFTSLSTDYGYTEPTHSLSDLTDVVSATNTNKFALMSNGTTGYIGRALVEVDISDLQTYYLASNPSGYTTNAGTVTSVNGGTGIDSSGGAAPSLSFDGSELGVGGTLIATDYLLSVNGGVSNKQLISSIPLSIFNNDLSISGYSGWNLYVDGVSKGSIAENEIVDFVGGNGIDLSYNATNNVITSFLDFTELPVTLPIASDNLVFMGGTDGIVPSSYEFQNIPLSIFNNDSNFIDNTNVAFTNVDNNFSTTQSVVSTAPRWQLEETDFSGQGKYWRTLVSSGSYFLQSSSDNITYEHSLQIIPNASIYLYYNGTLEAQTDSGAFNVINQLQVGGVNVNNTGTLTNVAYKNQNNNFSVGQTITGGGTSITLNHTTDYTVLKSERNSTRDWQIDNVSGELWVYNQSAAAYTFKLLNSGDATFTGDVSATDFIGTSDKRLKENVLELIPKRINSKYKTFNFIGNSQERVGVIAQELEVDYPEFVRTNEDGIKSVSYIDLHSAEISYLKNKVSDLEDKIELILSKI